jgi:hypothetical protein
MVEAVLPAKNGWFCFGNQRREGCRGVANISLPENLKTSYNIENAISYDLGACQ